MINKFFLPKIVILCSLLFLASCGPRYQKKSMQEIVVKSAGYKNTTSKVSLELKKLNPQEANELFDGRGHYLFKRYKRLPIIYPLHVTIQNQSNTSLVLRPHGIGLKRASNDLVIRKLKFDRSLRTVSAGFIGTWLGIQILVGGLMALLCPIAGPEIALLSVAGLAVTIGSGSGLFIATPAAMYLQNTRSAQANKIIEQDIEQKSFANQLVIEPNQTKDAMIFAHADYFKNEFPLVLFNQKNRKETIIFNVHLTSNHEIKT
jgi:hypothetical protein